MCERLVKGKDHADKQPVALLVFASAAAAAAPFANNDDDDQIHALNIYKTVFE